jgi:hypothetical protein
MDASAECTHCKVLMTGWAGPGSPVRYWRCPLCGHTHSSAYGEVFRNGAGARLVAPTVAGAPAAGRLPQASAEEIRWASVRARAARWFARLVAEERQAPARPPAGARYEPVLARSRPPGPTR